MEIETPECNRRIELMLHWVIMDEDTGDITGLRPDAPEEMIAEYQRYLAEMELAEALIR